MDVEQLAQQYGVEREDVPELLLEFAEDAYERYGESHDENDIETALTFCRAAVKRTAESDSRMGYRLVELADMLEGRYELDRTQKYLDEAIETSRRAIALTTTDEYSTRVIRSNNLGNLLETRYEETSALSDLQEAIDIATEALSLVPEDDVNRAILLSNLGNKLESRYRRMGELDDLENAIRTTKEALRCTPEDNDEVAMLMNNLGSKLSRRYEKTGNVSDLEEAIEAARVAIKSTSADHLDYSTWINNLSSRLNQRYERTGDNSNLEEAIQLARRAIGMNPRESSERMYQLTNLGNGLGNRYDRSGELVDLEEAIQTAREALAIAPPQHRDRVTWLHNLGNKLAERFSRRGLVGNLLEAIVMANEVVELTSKDHPFYASFLVSLGNKLAMRYVHPIGLEDTEAVQILDTAIAMTREAMDMTPTTDNEARPWSNELADKLIDRFDKKNDIVDLQEAISLGRQAAKLTASNNPKRVMILMNLGKALERQYKRTGETADLEEATSTFYEAWNSQVEVPFRRIRAAASCLKLLAIQERFDAASDLGRDVLDLVPTVNTNLLDRKDQQFAMSTFAGIAADVCAVLLAIGSVELALESLEKGRAVIISQCLDRRSDLSDLESAYPEIANRYHRLIQKVNTPFRGTTSHLTETELLSNHRELMASLNACISDIRGIKGYERFQLGQTLAEMQTCAGDGNIVIINATEFRSDAIVLTGMSVRPINLPNFFPGNMKALLAENGSQRPRGIHESVSNQYSTWRLAEDALRNAKLLKSPVKDDGFRQFLIQIWLNCVRLVLEELGIYKKGHVGELPRIWWLGSGNASSLPFHAAGEHLVGSTENTISWVISSYIPTIKTLRHSKDRMKRSVETNSALLITMPKTAGKADLPGVKMETMAIRNTIQHLFAIRELDLPRRDAVLEILGDCNLVHFACHGYSNPLDPSDSFLALSGNSDTEIERLSVHDILEISLSRAWLAYLSACSTAQIETPVLMDENIHLASSFLVAGFGHVIASMWPSDDYICTQVASAFYHNLTCSFGQDNKNRAVAAALHAAVKDIRLRNIDRPYLWTQYIHLGA
jgi:tetratricopeptide (TPR) repeat protein